METDLFRFNPSPGVYNDEEAAARAYDLAAPKYWGTSTFTNFPVWLLTYCSHKTK